VESVRSFERSTRSPEETFALGVALGVVLRARDYVGLEGQLGAGKTLFARGVAHGAEVPLDEVTSPSYSIVQTYQGRVLLHHADLYRLRSEDELYATGYFDLLESDGAWLVEWVGQVPGAAPTDALWLTMELVGPSERRLVGRATGPSSASLMERWLRREVDCISSPRGL
jgi:tRNA threonylcarbamoyladenosine biosynthesis protein TsaE